MRNKWMLLTPLIFALILIGCGEANQNATVIIEEAPNGDANNSSTEVALQTNVVQATAATTPSQPQVETISAGTPQYKAVYPTYESNPESFSSCSCTCCPEKEKQPEPVSAPKQEPAPQPAPSGPPYENRKNCSLIESDNATIGYHSPEERSWYKDNCQKKQAPPSPTETPKKKDTPPPATKPYCPQTQAEIANYAPGSHWVNESALGVDDCKWQTHGVQTRHTAIDSFTVKAGTQVDYYIGNGISFHACSGSVVPATPADGDLSLRFVFDPNSCNKQFGIPTTPASSPPPAQITTAPSNPPPPVTEPEPKSSPPPPAGLSVNTVKSWCKTNCGNIGEINSTEEGTAVFVKTSADACPTFDVPAGFIVDNWDGKVNNKTASGSGVYTCAGTVRKAT